MSHRIKVRHLVTCMTPHTLIQKEDLRRNQINKMVLQKEITVRLIADISIATKEPGDDRIIASKY